MTHKSNTIVLRRIATSSFFMGSSSTEFARATDEQRHRVVLTDAYYIAVFELTQAQYSQIMGTNPAAHGVPGGDHPVESVSWQAVRGGDWPGVPAGSGSPASDSLIGLLRARTGLPFDLPTEAQWECACRAGTTNSLNNSQSLNNRVLEIDSDYALSLLGTHWNAYFGISNGMVQMRRHSPAGSLLTNRWHLFDMHGNVAEWCLDWYTNDYGSATVTNPVGPASGTMRVVRGGSWYSRAEFARSASRDAASPTDAWFTTGIRVVVPANAVVPEGTTAGLLALLCAVGLRRRSLLF